MKITNYIRAIFKLESYLKRIGYFHFIYNTRETQVPITFKYWFYQKILGFNRKAYWPLHFTSIVTNPKNILCGIETSPGYMPGCYIQSKGKIYVGDYTQLASNVGLITSNHDIYNNRLNIKSKDIKIGKYCWIGMGSIILPGVILGDFTIVGAGSVVTKSFPDGYQIIVGNPATLKKKIDREKCVNYTSKKQYNGYIPNNNFTKFKEDKLNFSDDYL